MGEGGDLLRHEFDQAGIDQELSDLVIRCVQVDPQDRPESADQLVQVIENYRRDTMIRARDAQLNAERLRSRHRIIQLRLKIFAVVAVSLICIGGMAGWMKNRNQLVQAEQISEAKNSLANAQRAFEMACTTQKWQASEWLYADQSFESALPLVVNTRDSVLLEQAENLRKQKAILKLVREAMTVETNVKESVFHLPNRQKRLEQAFKVLVGQDFGKGASAGPRVSGFRRPATGNN